MKSFAVLKCRKHLSGFIADCAFFLPELEQSRDAWSGLAKSRYHQKEPEKSQKVLLEREPGIKIETLGEAAMHTAVATVGRYYGLWRLLAITRRAGQLEG